MLAAQVTNSDVQLPYRFPICPETHLSCEEACTAEADDVPIVQATQAGQDAQVWHDCDDCNKRQPMGFNEVKECCKGHTNLNSKFPP